MLNGVNPADFGGSIPYIPNSDISPIWNPEFFGNVMVVNGQSWPKMTVEKRRYRVRLINGCNSRTIVLRIASDPATRPAISALPFWQIGTEGGFLQAPVELPTLLMAPAERADIILDFTNVPEGTDLYLINEGPDEPFKGGTSGVDYDRADPLTTGQVMRFDVVAATSADTTEDPWLLPLPPIHHLAKEVRTRLISLNELDLETLVDHDNTPYAPIAAMLGTVTDGGLGVPLRWMDPPTETPTEGDTEVWEIHNYTEDAHPIHVHLVTFEVVNREDVINHQISPPELWERGFKDTVVAFPRTITRIRARFDKAGRYVWHCHIIEHEDNEMMRPYQVLNRINLPDVGNF